MIIFLYFLITKKYYYSELGIEIIKRTIITIVIISILNYI